MSANNSSVVLLPSLHAACVRGIVCFLTLSFILPITHMASTFLSIDSSIIGRRLSGGPLVFLFFEWGFFRVVSCFSVVI